MNGHITHAQIVEMRAWIADCGFMDLEMIGGVDELSDDEVIAGVSRHYGGGLEQFIRDEEAQ
jgi:hypothetical protein